MPVKKCPKCGGKITNTSKNHICECDNSLNSETKHEKFLRVAEPRINAVLDELRKLSNCSNTIVYEYSEEEIEKYFSKIEQALIYSKGRFIKKSNNIFVLK